tara:strand:+ start:123 stop:293 length:171 start_codon:yes stop_codon:yes gene_type:complete
MNNLDERLKQLVEEQAKIQQALNEINVLIDAYQVAIREAAEKSKNEQPASINEEKS